MFYETENGEEIAYVLPHPSGVHSSELHQAIEIKPDEVFWKERIGGKRYVTAHMRVPYEEGSAFGKVQVEYWVYSKDYNAIRDLVRLLQIDETYLDDLIYIVINYNTFLETIKYPERLLQPNDAQILNEFLREFRRHDTQVTEISVKIARRDKSALDRKFLKPRRFVINNVPLIFEIIGTIEYWRAGYQIFGPSDDPDPVILPAEDFKRSYDPDPVIPPAEDFKKITLGKQLTELKERYLIVFYDFLFEKKLANSHQDACRKLGVLWSFHPGTVPSYEDWLTEYSEDEGRSYYENHVADLMRMKISRALEKSGRTKRA